MKRRLLVTCLIGYGVLLTWGILLKFALPPYYFPMLYRSLNLIPYHDLARTWNGRLDIMEILLNIGAFVPLGVLLFLFLENKNLYKTILFCMGISLIFESIQFIFAIGMADITDVIHNSLGSLLGIFAVILWWKTKRNQVLS